MGQDGLIGPEPLLVKVKRHSSSSIVNYQPFMIMYIDGLARSYASYLSPTRVILYLTM